MGAVAVVGAVGAAVQVAGAAASFVQANKENDRIKEADAAAAKAMIKQANLLETNFAEQVQVPLEGYELAAQANAAVQQQNIEALQQAGDRSLIGGVGRTMEAGAVESEKMRIGMQKELYDRQVLIKNEDDKIRDAKRAMELGIVSGAQTAAAQAETRRQQMIAQGVQGLAGAAATGLEASGLYSGLNKQKEDGTLAPTQNTLAPTQNTLAPTQNTLGGVSNPGGTMNFGNSMYNPDGTLNFGNSISNLGGTLKF